jgi:hypothetical protein
MSLATILKGQIAWAGTRSRRQHVLDQLADNLFQPLHPGTYAEFARGSGDELGLGGRTGKMRSLRSSSALACNVFDPWRGRPLAPLAHALEADGPFTELSFERKVPHGLGSFPPNLDVMLFGRDIAPVGIEAKFAEPFGEKKPCPALDDKYFPADRQRWADVGLPATQALARAIGRSEQFVRLGAGQLVKHLLGLATTFPQFTPIRLRYVWFDAGGAEDDAHRAEIERFARLVSTEVDFVAIRYQDLYTRLISAPEPAPGYLSYLRARYFAP